jgi:large subunit ribosomal protein L10
MSKVLKQMELDDLKNTFKGVRDMVVLSIKGLSCLGDSTFRTALRKKKVRLKVVKNTLTRRVFNELGLSVKEDSPYWVGPTAVAWGESSVAEVSRAIESELKAPKTAPLYKDKVNIKGAVADGQEVTFEAALKYPTRLEAIGAILAMILGPGSAVAGCINAPGGQIAGQVHTISEKKDEAAPAAG